jgi:Holliday junction resolvasome RuvABC ATP-dependent DNA helicase subunit
MTNQTIYTVGGTVQAGGGVYIPRKADDELLAYCRASEFAFILSSRQVGKSSLMVRTARQLEGDNIRSVIIDLSSIGVKTSADEWYLGILNIITEELKLKTDIFSWWLERSRLGHAQHMTNFFRDVLLKEISEPVVLFFDEIDSTLSIPFSDDFFAALRFIYNARSTIENFKRLSFVMIGVATPSDLISDSTRTPFNIGRRVELTDFTLEELNPLANGLGENAEQVLRWIFEWTNGHPYLTQRLCAFLTKSRNAVTKEVVEAAVKDLFLGEKGMEDNNLQFVRDMLLERAPDKTGVLKIYQHVIKDKKPIADDEQSLNKSHLKLSGVVRRRQTNLRVSNLIYQNVFDLKWVKEHLPHMERRTLGLVTSLATVIIALAVTSVLYLNQIPVSKYEIISAPIICTPESPNANIYRTTPQMWANMIFQYAYPSIPIPTTPDATTPTPPIVPNEQQILGARYEAFQYLINQTKRWSDIETIKLDNLNEAQIVVTFISPELIQAVFLNEVLKDRIITSNFDVQLQNVLNSIADRDELIFLVTVTATNNNTNSTRHTIKIPIQSIVLQNDAEYLLILHNHDDHNLEQPINPSVKSVFGYIAYPLAVLTSKGCTSALDPKYNTNIVITVPDIKIDNVSSGSYTWTIPYKSQTNANTPPAPPIFIPRTSSDSNQISPLSKPPYPISSIVLSTGVNSDIYWQDFARFIWNQVTLGSY